MMEVEMVAIILATARNGGTHTARAMLDCERDTIHPNWQAYIESEIARVEREGVAL